MSATKQKHRRTTKSIQVPQKNLQQAIRLVEAKIPKFDHPEIFSGDTVKVHVKIKEGEKERIQIYEGIVIHQSNPHPHRSFTVRKISHGVGVERIFVESSPKIAKIERVAGGKVRRAKLYYLRDLVGKAAKIIRK